MTAAPPNAETRGKRSAAPVRLLVVLLPLQLPLLLPPLSVLVILALFLLCHHQSLRLMLLHHGGLLRLRLRLLRCPGALQVNEQPRTWTGRADARRSCRPTST